MVKKILYTDINISRLDSFIDNYLNKNKKLPDGFPTFSSIEISINGACNRRCFFCPRVDKKNYPNILNSLNMDTFKNLIHDLKKINFDGRISFSGFCEPLLTKNLDAYVKFAKENIRDLTIEIVTNGDPLLAKNGEARLKELFHVGLSNIRVSLYDGPHQVDLFESLKKKLSLTDDQFIIRKRYLGPDKSYGITISNRAGSVKLKNEVFELKELNEPLRQPCYYPFYKVLIDYNGDVLMCSNDWKKELSMGNITNQSIVTIWSDPKFLELRKKLINADRNHKPCNVCDVNGMLNGRRSFDEWKDYFSKKIKN
jgi:radical SAM protein with 4Fe4S-binding SPASM domain